MQGVDAYDYISKPEAATSAWQQPAAITQQHLLDALARLRKRTATAIGAPQARSCACVDGCDHESMLGG